MSAENYEYRHRFPIGERRPGYCAKNLHRIDGKYDTYTTPSGDKRCRACNQGRSGRTRVAKVMFTIEVTRNEIHIRDVKSYTGKMKNGCYQDGARIWTVVCGATNFGNAVDSVVSQSSSILRVL